MTEREENSPEDGEPSSLQPVLQGRGRGFTFLLILFLIVALIGFVYQSLMVSLALSLFFTYLLAPLVRSLESRTHLGRMSSASLVLAALLAFLTVIVALLLPVIYREMMGLLRLLPQAFDYASGLVEPLKLYVVRRGWIELSTIEEVVREFSLFSQFTDQAQSALEKLWAATPTLLGGVLNVLLVPLLTFFLLTDLEVISGALRRLTPPDLRTSMNALRERVDRTLRSVLKGQVIVAFTLGVLYMIGFSLVGLQSALAIGAIAGVCRIVPYMDVVVGGLLSLVVIVTGTGGFAQAIGVLIVFVFVQSLDGMLITPRVVGERAGLHPGVVIASVLAFGDWFGVFGVLIAIPLVAIAVVVSREVAGAYFQSRFFLEGSGRPDDSPG